MNSKLRKDVGSEEARGRSKRSATPPEEEFPPVTLNNLCCIIKPFSACRYCKGLACEDCDVWVVADCPAAPEIGQTHHLTYTPKQRIAEMQRRMCG